MSLTHSPRDDAAHLFGAEGISSISTLDVARFAITSPAISREHNNYGGGREGGKNERDDQFILFDIMLSTLFDYSYITLLKSPKGLIPG
jgi:hypothetical protein